MRVTVECRNGDLIQYEAVATWVCRTPETYLVLIEYPGTERQVFYKGQKVPADRDGVDLALIGATSIPGSAFFRQIKERVING